MDIKKFKFPNVSLFSVTVFAVFLVSIIALYNSFSYLVNNELTNRESLMLGLLQTILSLYISWYISHLYAKRDQAEQAKEFKSNLKLYALKAAEKVDNLSSELVRLADYLQEELEKIDENENSLARKNERIRSSIHIISTLKSINDNSLSDWRGVIPEELELRDLYEIRSAEALLDADEKLDFISSEITKISDQNGKGQLVAEINKLKKFLTHIASTRTTPSPYLSQIKRVSNEFKCSYCNEIVSYKQKPLPTSRKKVKCKNCGSFYISEWNEDSFSVTSKRNTSDSRNIVENKDLIEKALKLLPAQPWSKGISAKVADELGISHSQMGKIIRFLISQGRFLDQKNGVLISPSEIKQDDHPLI